MANGYQGRLANWHPDKGFGFIQPFDGGKQIFTHVNAWLMPPSQINIGMTVKYGLTTDNKGRICAVNVLEIPTLLEGASIEVTFKQWTNGDQLGMLVNEDYPSVHFLLLKSMVPQASLQAGQKVTGVLKLHNSGRWLLLEPKIKAAPDQGAVSLPEGITIRPKAIPPRSQVNNATSNNQNVEWRENMTLTGVVQNWQDQKGFGFLKTQSHPGRVFFHINDYIEFDGRPEDGMTVRFVLKRGDDQQWRATSCQCVQRPAKKKLGQNSSSRHSKRHTNASIHGGVILAALLGSVFIGILGWFVPALALWCVVMSALSFSSYKSDKKAALRKTWRVSENRLHLQDLLGGWPGGWVARESLRHKTTKTSFVVVFWLTVVVNMVFVVWFGRPIVDALLLSFQ